MKIPYKDRAEFFKYQSAGVCFDMVCDISKYFLRVKPHRSDKIHDPLLVALHVLYGRPFKQRAILRLDPSIVPDHFKSLHEKLITIRDKMHAHTDLDGPELCDGVGLNHLTGYTKDGWTTFGINIYNLNLKAHQAIVLLAEDLAKKTHDHAQGIWAKYMLKKKVPDGVTMVNMAPDDGPFLVPHPAALTDRHDNLFVEIAEYKKASIR